MVIQANSSFIDIRTEQGYSITSLAKAMNVSPSTVLYIERGKNIHPATAKKACKVLGMPFADLFIIQGKSAPNKQPINKTTNPKEGTQHAKKRYR